MSNNTQLENAEHDQLKERKLTYGEKAVGIRFNPGGNPSVEEIKRSYAHIIDCLNIARMDETASGEEKRLFSVAITEAQSAQMWAVKAITWED